VSTALRDSVDLALTGRVRLALNRVEFALLLVSEELQRASAGRDPRIDRLAAAIAADLRGDWSVADMARLVELSPVQLTRLCSRHLGESPHRLVERLRLDAASQELASGTATAQEIAARVGFANVSHFTRRFRAQFAMPPGTWRERHRR
jgi:AraC-like DNA-binding protein